MVLLSASPSLLYGHVRLESTGNAGVEILFDAGELEEVLDEQGHWLGVRVPGFAPMLDDSLGLEVPVRTCLLGVPEGSHVTCKVSDANYYEVEGYDIENWREALDPRLADLPREPAEITLAGYLRRQRVASLRIAPLVYDEGSGNIVVYTRLRVSVDFGHSERPDPQTGATGVGRSAPGDDELFYQRAIVNYEQAKAWRRPWARTVTQGDYFSKASVWIKATVEATGIYCITGADLEGIGIDIDAIDGSSIRLYTGGGLPLKETLAEYNPAWMRLVPVKVDDGGDGIFDRSDCILFYGLSVSDWADFYGPGFDREAYNESFYSNYNYYWLTWGGSFSEPPRSMEVRDLLDCDGCSFYEPVSFRERVHVETNAFADFSISADDGWYWRLLNLGNEASFSAPTPDPDVGEPAVVKVRIADPHDAWARPPECPGDYYRAVVRLNDIAVQDTFWYAAITSKMVIDIYGKGALENGGQQMIGIYLPTGLAPPDEDETICDIKPYLAWFDVYYWRRFVSDGNRLFFLSPDTTCLAKYVVGEFTASPQYVLDVTDQFDVRELSGFEVTGGGTDFEVAFYDSARKGDVRRYAIVSSDGLLKPKELIQATISNIRYASGKPYCIVTHEDLLNAAVTMAGYHDGEIVTVQQIYDEFGWGVPDVTAVRDFLRWRYERGSLNWILFLGKATWDYKGYRRGENFPNYVPSYERRYLPFVKNPRGDPYNTDDWLVYLVPADGDSVAYFPTVSVSRLPAISPEDAAFLVEKSIEYISNPILDPWQNRVILVADDDQIPRGCEDGSSHTRDVELLSREFYPLVFEHRKIYLTEYPMEVGKLKPEARRDFVSALNEGALISNFAGHGDPNRLAQEEVFNPAAIELVHAGMRQSFFIAASCNVSKFNEPDLLSMAERLLARREGGTIGSLASTHLCLPGPNRLLNSNFVGALFDSQKKYPTIAISDAAAIAKALTAAVDRFQSYWRNNEMYAVFGDPALELAVPKMEIVFEGAAPDTVRRKQSYDLSAAVHDEGGLVTGFDGTTGIYAREADDTTGYQSCDPGNFMDYDLPGHTIFRGRTGVRDGIFDFSFFVASNAREGRRGSVRCFATDGLVSASGLLDSLNISGAAVADDDAGPEIDLYSNGRVVVSGDTLIVGDRVEVRLSDESGVAIKGKSDFIPSVSIAYDDVERVSLAESLYAVDGSYVQSVTVFVVPQLAGGVHKFSVAAFDNLNNLTTKDYDLVIGLAAAGAGNVVYVYPNPAHDRCYIVWEYENDRYVEIEATIYTLSGRKIWTGSTSGRGSFHWIEWDGADLVGDKVANGTYLVVVEAGTPSDASFSTSDKTAIVLAR
jgi:hypothetical protein